MQGPFAKFHGDNQRRKLERHSCQYLGGVAAQGASLRSFRVVAQVPGPLLSWLSDPSPPSGENCRPLLGL